MFAPYVVCTSQFINNILNATREFCSSWTVYNKKYIPPVRGEDLKKDNLYPIQYTVDINAYTVILITTDRQNQFKI